MNYASRWRLAALTIISLISIIGACRDEEDPILPPEIANFSPTSGLPGVSVSITGKNFSRNAADNIVKLGEVTATVTAASATSLTFTVPAGAKTGLITVKTNEITVTSATEFVVPPVIDSFLPASAKTGATVTITGSGFSTVVANNTVKFGDEPATVTAATATSLTVTVPEKAVTGKISIAVNGHEAISVNDFEVIPNLTGFSPKFGAIGSTVTLHGSGFNPSSAENIAKVNGKTAIVTASTSTTVTITIPSDAESGLISLSTNNTLLTSSYRFTIATEVISIAGPDYDISHSMDVDADGNIYVTGSFAGTAAFGSQLLTSQGSFDVFVAKFNPSLELVWAQQAGGLGREEALAISVDNQGNTYVSGMSYEPVTISGTTFSGPGTFVAKIDANGNFKWAKQVGNLGNYTDFGTSVAVDNQGHVYATGPFNGTFEVDDVTLSSVGDWDISLLKLNTANGKTEWAKSFGGSRFDIGYDLAVNESGDRIFMVGAMEQHMTIGGIELSGGSFNGFIASLDSNGNVKYANSLYSGEWTRLFSVEPLTDGCYVAGEFRGETQFGQTKLTSNGFDDMVVAKISENGNILWAKTAGGESVDGAYAVAADDDGNAYATGYFNAVTKFGQAQITSQGDDDVFVTKLSPQGDFIWTKSAGTVHVEDAQGIAVDEDDVVYITGNFHLNTIFGWTELEANSFTDVFVWRIWQ